MTLRKPRIVISAGDPAGIGPEIALKALADPAVSELAEWLLVADTAVLITAAASTGIDPRTLPHTPVTAENFGKHDAICMGEIRAEHGLAAIDYVRRATEMCLHGEADALVTAPLNKEAVTLSGRTFSGHTEYIAELTGATESRMLLVSDRLATVHVSTHVSLRRACELETERIVRTIQLGHNALLLLRDRAPRIAVCGLNPHAGEHNLFGTEDSERIAPAVARARSLGMNCSGPHSPDTVFLSGVRGEYDLIVAMYHDQGHIPMKLIDFANTVNVSLGLPIIRTSVDHGTAFDIAGRNMADATNMKAAMRMAARMAAGRLARVAEQLSHTTS